MDTSWFADKTLSSNCEELFKGVYIKYVGGGREAEVFTNFSKDFS